MQRFERLDAGFSSDPIATHSAQFPTARRMDQEPQRTAEAPSCSRPWSMALLSASTPSSRIPRDRAYPYDPETQTCRYPYDVLVAGDPTANSVSNNDGDEGPSEDWSYDFAPDQPSQP